MEMACLGRLFRLDHAAEVKCSPFMALKSILRLLILKWWLFSVPRLTVEQASVPLLSSFRLVNPFHHSMHE